MTLNHASLERIGQTVKVKNHAHHVFKPMYLMDYRVLKILSGTVLFLVTPNGREFKTNINNIKLYKEDWAILHMLGCQAIALPSTE